MPRRDVNDQVRDASFRDRVEMGTDQCACCPRTRCSLVSGFPDCPGLNFVSFFIQSGLHKRERERCRRKASAWKRRRAEFGPLPGRADQGTVSLRCLIPACLDCASFGRRNLGNADSTRCCRFRNSQQKRASDLDPTYVWIAKLSSWPCGPPKVNENQVGRAILPAAGF